MSEQTIPADIDPRAEEVAAEIAAHGNDCRGLFARRAISRAILAERQKHDLPTSPDLQAEAERVFADVQRAVLVEDAKAEIAKALRAAKDEATEAAAVRYRQLWTNDYPSELSSNRVRHLVRALRAIRNQPQLDA